MINYKRWIVLGLFFLWGFFCWYRYTSVIKGFIGHKPSGLRIEIVKIKTKITKPSKQSKQAPLHNQDSILLSTAPAELNLEKDLIILYKSKSIHRDSNAVMDAKIKQLAALIKHNGKSISIIGFTSKNEDITLGRTRAWLIKKAFLTQGVNSAQLKTESQESSTPSDKLHSKFSDQSSVIITF